LTVRSRLLAVAGLLGAAALAAAAVVFFTREGGHPRGAETLAADAAHPSGMKAGAYDPPQAAPEFSLLGSDGSEVNLARYRGKVVLMSFGFTYCAAVCPTTLATLAQAREELGADASSVQVIFVTVDPARDQADHMREYLAAFGDGFVGATGSDDALAAVREKYGVTAAKQGEGPDYVMAHTSSIFIIDRAGRLRAMMPFGHEASDFAHDIRLLLED
jgi:protein SCO1/2